MPPIPDLPIIKLAVYGFIAAEVIVFGLFGVMIWWGFREHRADTARNKKRLAEDCDCGCQDSCPVPPER